MSKLLQDCQVKATLYLIMIPNFNLIKTISSFSWSRPYTCCCEPPDPQSGRGPQLPGRTTGSHVKRPTTWPNHRPAPPPGTSSRHQDSQQWRPSHSGSNGQSEARSALEDRHGFTSDSRPDLTFIR